MGSYDTEPTERHEELYMTETQTERETEIVAGTIGGITQKKADTWTVAVAVEGFANPKNLWTKDAELIESLQAKFGQAGAFVCNASYWQHPQHGQVRSLWIEEQENADGIAATKPTESGATPAAATLVATTGSTSPQPMSKEEWARKDAAIHEMACIKTAADALKHTIPSDPTPEDLTKFLGRVATLTASWHRLVLSVRDGEDVPF